MHTKPKILTYDIESTPLKAYIWSLGDQTVRYGQLTDDAFNFDIICAAWCWNDGEPAQVMGWGYDDQDSSALTAKLDELIREADVVIGKNNARFDNKHLNMHRLIHNRDGMPDWLMKSDDLEKHIRKHFALPSYGLDYISQLLGLGGKDKMQFSDWIDIVEKRNPDSYKKMMDYCRKDVEDTRTIWDYCSKHFTPRYNVAAANNTLLACKSCGSTNIYKNGTRLSGGVRLQSFMCRDHGGFATNIPISKIEKLNKEGIII